MANIWSISLCIFLLGLFIGSFLNVVIYRYGTGGWWRGRGKAGRSKCFSCGKTLAWYELVPLLSFLIQRGRCRGCRSRIAWQYPAVELLTSLGFLAVWQLFASPLFLFPNPYFLVPVYWLIISLLIIILVYDLRHKIIPDGPVFAFIGLSLVATISRSFLAGVTGLDWHLLGAHLLTALVFFLFFWALWYFSGGRWMGFGDAKLVVGVGLLLGPSLGASAIVLAFWSGALVGVGLILYGKLRLRWLALAGRRGASPTMKSELPFAPFIILGLALAL